MPVVDTHAKCHVSANMPLCWPVHLNVKAVGRPYGLICATCNRWRRSAVEVPALYAGGWHTCKMPCLRQYAAMLYLRISYWEPFRSVVTFSICRLTAWQLLVGIFTSTGLDFDIFVNFLLGILYFPLVAMMSKFIFLRNVCCYEFSFTKFPFLGWISQFFVY